MKKRYLCGLALFMLALAIPVAFSSCASFGLPVVTADEDLPLTRTEEAEVFTGDDTLPIEDNPYFVTLPDMPDVSEGVPAISGGEWPDSVLAALVPKPDFRFYAASDEEDVFSAAFMSVELSQIKDYAAKLKARGFTVDPEENEQSVMGIVTFGYSASNGAGVRASVSFAAGSGSLTVVRE